MIVDINTCFGTSPKRRVSKTEHVTRARMCREHPGLAPTTQDVDWSLDNLLRILDRQQVTRACAYSLRGRLYDFVSGNDETLNVAMRYRQITPVATIDPRRHFGCLDEVERCVDNGFRIFRFFPDEQGWSVSSLPFITLCEELAQYPVTIMIPAGPWGRQTRVAEEVCSMDLRVVAMEPTFDLCAESAALAKQHETFYVDTSAVNTVDTIEGLVADGLGEKLLFGSDSPQMYFESAYRMVDVARIADSEKDAIFAGNALAALLEGVGE